MATSNLICGWGSPFRPATPTSRPNPTRRTHPISTTSADATHFDNARDRFQSYSIDLIMLDQRLREYGPGADFARASLRAYTAAAIADTWPNEPPPTGIYPPIPVTSFPIALRA